MDGNDRSVEEKMLKLAWGHVLLDIRNLPAPRAVKVHWNPYRTINKVCVVCFGYGMIQHDLNGKCPGYRKWSIQPSMEEAIKKHLEGKNSVKTKKTS